VDNWELSVSDNGLGVDPKYFEKIFQLFQRLDGDKSGRKGTGVGLAICKKIVELHKGSIHLESKPGEGTVFYITIPKNINQNG
jgi:signal transduction histidine kinase